MKYKINNKEINEALKDSAIKEKSTYYQFGWKCFGPFLLGFTKWLNLKLESKKIRKVYFFSRDGYMMEKAYNLLNAKTSDTEYVYFSRKSIRQALLYTCDTFEESLAYLSIEKFVSLGKILEYYGFSKQERSKLAYDNNWNLLSEYEYETLQNNSVVAGIYDKLKSRIKEKSEKQRIYLLKYLNQIKFYGDCAIVDIGWHGSMQYYLEKFCELNGVDARMHGYYVGILPNVPLKGSTDGYIYNVDNPQLRKSMLCFFGVLEKLFQSMEGSTYGYKQENDKIVPVCNEYEFAGKNEFTDCINEWQNAAINFVNKTINIYIKEEEFIRLAYPLIKFGKNPSLKDVELFSFFYNTDGIKEYYVSQKGLLKYKPKELIRTLSNSVWKTGFMKSVFKVPFPYFYIYSWLRK